MPSRRTLAYGLVIAVVVAAAGTLTVAAAERRALAAEEAHVTDRLGNASCLTDWGTNEGGGPRREASVRGPAVGGLRVAVTLPYAYTTEADGETVHADTASNAVYEVSLAGTRRVRGDEVAPC